jgi:hypothetical protein
MKNNTRLKSFALIITLLTAFAFPTSAQAQGIVYGDTIPAGKTVDYDVVLIGQNVVLDGTVNGNVIILGNQVVINGTVDGSLVLIGQNAVIGGAITGAVYASALTLELAPGADLARELYVITVSLVSQPGSNIGRDLFAVSLDAGLNGRIGRAPHTAIGPIQLYNGLMTLLGFDELTIKLHIDFSSPPAAPDDAGEGTRLPFGTRLHARRVLQQAEPFDWIAWGIERTREYIVLSLFALLAFAFMRAPLARAGEPLNVQPFKTTGIGLVTLVIVVNLFGAALLLAALIFSIGLGLNYLGLWQLSVAIWIAAYSTLALAMIALWFLVVYGTKIVVVYLASNWLIVKTGQTTAWLRVLTLLIGMLLFVLLRAVPYVGWVIGVLVTAAGIGSLWLAYRPGRMQLPNAYGAIGSTPLRVTANAAGKRKSLRKST